MRVEELDTPAMVVDLDRAEANIAALMGRFAGTRVRVRPHLKTTKSPQFARMLAEAGAQGFCVSKLGEAEVMADAGLDDLLITGELAGAAKLARLAALARRHPELRLRAVVDSAAGARALDAALADTPRPLEVLIELNVGQNRCGVAPGEPALELARQLAGLARLRLVGVQGYEGHLQHLADAEQRAREVDAAMEKLGATVRLLREHGFAVETVTTGGTGTCALCARHPEVNEVQPGSFVFLDTAYRDALGESSAYVNALTVLATVISRPTPTRAVLDAGTKSLSTDMGNAEPHELAGVRYRPGGDEHGILEWEAGAAVRLAVGDVVALIPSHIDTTVNLHDEYLLARGGEVVGSWPVAARGRVR
jgi:D-serine deaminase-like pyridoxal phosphate-dependent protein